MEGLGNENYAKLCPKYICEKCEYITDKKSSYENHLKSQRHRKWKENNKKLCFPFFCPLCCKNYATDSGLWKHRNKCKPHANIITENNISISIEETPILENNINHTETNSEIKDLTKLVIKVLEQNQELTKQIVELSKTTTNNINNIINNNNNNNFNLNIFLNETCKNAVNMSDFIESLNVTIEDLEETGAVGYTDGVSNVFLNGLNELDTHNRPIQCSDFRREILYIRDDNKWYKESETKSKLLQAIKMITKKHISTIFEWQKLHPEYNDPDSKQNDRYQQIILSSMPGSTIEESNKNYDKIIRRLAKASIIKKK